MIAVIGDVHGCITELEELYKHLTWSSTDEVWIAGDLCDRGPDTAAVIQFCQENNIKSIKGNHDFSIVNHYERYVKNGSLPHVLEKQKTIKTINNSNYLWLKSLPNLHIDDNRKLIIVHGGLWPSIPLYAQPENVIRAQMIQPESIETRWWGVDAIRHKSGKTEEQNIAEGFNRWYKLWDHEYSVIYGHSTYAQPSVYKREDYGSCIGVDTGVPFGGMLTACLYKDENVYSFLSVKSKKVYYEDTYRSFWET